MGTERGGDNLLIVYWLYNITGDAELLRLGELIHSQSADWTARFTTDDHLYRQNSLHCVNLAQGFKEPVMYYQQSKRAEHLQAPHEALRRIRRTIGFPTGLWAGDELLHFGDPARGSELCTAVEMMYSLEEMYRVTGDNAYADLLERIAYNALPTQITDCGDARQYYQQVNQVKVTREQRNFSTPHQDTDILFGQLTGYPCCTCNLHQGWPKFVQNLWYKTADGGLAAMVYAPSTVTTSLASGAEVTWSDGDEVTIEFVAPVRVSYWYDDAAVIERGPLVYALRMEERWSRHDCDDEPNLGRYYYEVTSPTRWNVALRRDDLRSENIASRFTVERGECGDAPWSLASAPIAIKARANVLPDWRLDRNSAASFCFMSQHAPTGEVGPETEITLIPYGCTTLRVTEFPVR